MVQAFEIFHFFYVAFAVFVLCGVWAVGGVIVFALAWGRYNSKVARGTIVGFTKVGAAYYPVAEFTARDGVLRRQRSDTGSSAVDPRLIGRPTMVRYTILPDGSIDVHVPTPVSYIFAAFGLVFFGMTFFMGYSLHPHWPHFAAAVGFAAVSFLRHGGRLQDLVQTFKTRGLTSQTPRAPAEVELVSMADIQQLRMTARANLRKVPVRTIAVVGAALLFLAAYLFSDTRERLSTGQRTTGRIAAFESSPSGHNTVYYPVVEFEFHGQTVKFRDSVGSSLQPPLGSSVPVIFDENQPTRAMIDRGIWNWLPSVACAAFGALLLFISWRTREALNVPPGDEQRQAA